MGSYILGSVVWAQIYIMVVHVKVTYLRIVRTRRTSPYSKNSRETHRLSSTLCRLSLMGLIFPWDNLGLLHVLPMPEFSLWPKKKLLLRLLLLSQVKYLLITSMLTFFSTREPYIPLCLLLFLKDSEKIRISWVRNSDSGMEMRRHCNGFYY